MCNFNPGDQVYLLADPGQQGIVRVLAYQQGPLKWFRVFFGGAIGVRDVLCEDLGRADANESPFGGAPDFARRVTYERLRRGRPLRNNIYAFNASRTKFFPHQFKPLLKLLDSHRLRLLIADEVGLGKTIEAGLILTELRARGDLRRVLVVCPSGLTEKWRMELKNRFGESEFKIYRKDSLSDWIEEYEEDGQTRLNGIIALETLRVETTLQNFEEVGPSLGLCIIDEAHHMRNRETLAWRAGRVLSALSEALIMLSATPVQLGSENLFSLLNLLDEDEFPHLDTAQVIFEANRPIVAARRAASSTPPDWEGTQQAVERIIQLHAPRESGLADSLRASINSLLNNPNRNTAPERSALIRTLDDMNLLGHLISRTRRREVQSGAQRQPHAVAIDLNPAELSVYRAVTRFTRTRAALMQQDPHVREWMVMTPQRRMASSIHALVRSVRTAIEQGEFGVDDEDIDVREDVTPTDLEQFRLAESELRELIGTWDPNTPDSKFAAFEQVLRSDELAQGKVIVFATFRGTLGYLAEKLQSVGIGSVLITGETPAEDRPRIIETFRSDPGTRVLLSSRVGSEGLDFQFCHVMVNYDLPWNPTEVEQRIGRLDRIGQEAPIIKVYNLWLSGSIEHRILSRLYERIGVFEETLGGLEGILGPIVRGLEREAFSMELSDEQLWQIAEEHAVRLLNEAHQTEQIDEVMPDLLAADHLFAEEAAQIGARQRYVTPRQARAFVEDFLRRKAPQSAITTTDESAKVFRVHPQQDLHEIITGTFEIPNRRLLDKYQIPGAEIEVTFDGPTAFRRPELDFLNVLHPILELARQSLAHDPAALLDLASLQFRSNLLPAGTYFFGLYVIHARGWRDQATMELVIVDSQGSPVFDESDRTAACEKLLSTLVEEAESTHAPPSQEDRSVLQSLLSPQGAITSEFFRRLGLLKSELQRSNSAVVDRRMSSLRSDYKRRLDLHEQSASSAIARGAPPYRVQAIRTRITNVTAELDSRLALEEARRHVNVTSDPPCVSGIVRVTGFLP